MNERYEIWTLDDNGFPMDMTDVYDSDERELAIADYKSLKQSYIDCPMNYYDVVLYQRIM